MWCVALMEMNEGNSLGKGTIGLQAAVPKRPHTRPLTLTFNLEFCQFSSYCDIATRADN